jgi:mono/diheme cytochrome c family protein
MLFGIAAILGLAGLTSCASRAPGGASGTAATPAVMTPEQKIERGRYLVTIGSCGDCHTPGAFYGAADSARMFAGSELGWVGPWGTSYPSNLTPDPETGIGKWSEGDIINAIKRGVKADGSPIMPPMPWPNLAYLTDEDASAIAAFLKSIPPVVHAVPALVRPGVKPLGPVLTVPAPSAWDAPKAAPAAIPPATGS